MAQPLALPTWPEKSNVAVSLTFDVDAEAGWLGESTAYKRRLTSLSEARFGVVRGLPRILDLLADYSLPATFYVPGDTVRRHPGAIREIVQAGHEVGHHGHLHLRSDRIDFKSQEREIQAGISSIEDALQCRPRGYRSPAWELTPETFRLVAKEFDYDSSCMGDDRPYVEELDGNRVLELPVHWSLDDHPYFAWTVGDGGILADPDRVSRLWASELDSAAHERRHLTYTMHPEVIGRSHRFAVLQHLIEHAFSETTPWFATHDQVVGRLEQCAPSSILSIHA